jgi:hypothetical protein
VRDTANNRRNERKLEAEAAQHERLEWARSIAARHRMSATAATALRDPRRA